MPTHFRIPPAPLGGPLGRLATWYCKRTYGQVPDNIHVVWYHRPMMRALFGFEGRLARWNALDPQLKAYAELASAGVIGCSWCLDFGYFMSQHKGLDLAKLREVPRWRQSQVFDQLERDVMEYAEAMSMTPPTVTDEMVSDLDRRLGHAAMVELTMMIAVENERSRFNSAMGLASQGFSDSCELPLNLPAAN